MVSTEMSATLETEPRTFTRRIEQLYHRGLYSSAQLLRGRPVGRCIRRLSEWDGLDAERLGELKRERLAEILSYARKNVPLYSTKPWAAAQRAAPEDIRHWPVLQRGALLEHGDALLAGGSPRGLVARRSSASTGVPVTVYWNREALGWSWAGEYQPMLWHRLPIGVRTLRIWGSGRPLESWILNRHFVPADELTTERMDEAEKYLETRRPELIWGTPSAVSKLARHIGARSSAEPLAKYVKVGGEQLYAFQRAEIERNLGARVVDTYGCTEVGSIAAECPQGSMHVLANVHVEIFNDGEPAAPGEFGDIVATTLINRGMPLVRCRIGDLGRLSPKPCGCGRPQPVLEELRGRAADLLLATDGSALHSSVLGDALHRHADAGPLRQARTFMFAQLDRHSWQVEVEAPALNETDVLRQQVLDLLGEAFGPGCEAEVKLVPKIAREASGKYRYYRTPAGSQAANAPGGG